MIFYLRQILSVLVHLLRVTTHIDLLLQQIIPGPAQSATLNLIQGDFSMPVTVTVSKTAHAVFTEFDGPNGTGNVVPPLGPVLFTSSDPAVATVDANGQVTAVAAGSAVITGTDQGNSLTASDTLTVTAAISLAQSATLTLLPQ